MAESDRQSSVYNALMLHTLTIVTVPRSCRLLVAAWGSLVLIFGLAGESSIASESTGKIDSVHSDASSEGQSAGSIPHEQKTLAEIWLAYTRSSTVLSFVVEKLTKRGWADAKIAGFLANPEPMAWTEGQHSASDHSSIALTDPNFEPTYPVLNDDRPSYLRVGRAKTLTCNSVSILAPVRSISKEERETALSQSELISLRQMVRCEADLFASYVRNFREMRTFNLLRGIKDRSSRARGKLRIDQFERFKTLLAEHDSLRAELVARIGQDAALNFDEKLQIGFSSSSSSSSKNE